MNQKIACSAFWFGLWIDEAHLHITIFNDFLSSGQFPPPHRPMNQKIACSVICSVCGLMKRTNTDTHEAVHVLRRKIQQRPKKNSVFGLCALKKKCTILKN
jgi:hypothetical protein